MALAVALGLIGVALRMAPATGIPQRRHRTAVTQGRYWP
jgi:hypothetical protein